MTSTHEMAIRIDWTPPEDGRQRGTARIVLGDTSFTDTLDITSHRAREKLTEGALRRIPALDTEANREALSEKLEAYAANEAERRIAPAQAANPEPYNEPDPQALLKDTPVAVVREAREMLLDPALSLRLIDDFEAVGIAGEREFALLTYLIGTSRRLGSPLAAIVQGSSSTGKSYVPEQIARLFPAEALMRLTTMTPEALVHMKVGTLRHQFILAGERPRAENDQTADIRRSLREMLSSQRLTKAMPIKTPGAGVQTILIDQPGPIAFMESTTREQVFYEDATRCLLLNTDESTDQTVRIIEAAARRAQAGIETSTGTPCHARHHAVQRIIATAGRPARVVVPFAEQIAAKFPTHTVVARRTFNLLVGAIKSSALLHHLQRDRDADDSIVATRADYKLVRPLLTGPLSRTLGDRVTQEVQKTHNSLIESVGVRYFTIADARAATGQSESTLRRRLNQAIAAGLAEQVTDPRGQSPARYQLIETGDDGLPLHDSPIPTAKEVFCSSNVLTLGGRTASATTESTSDCHDLQTHD